MSNMLIAMKFVNWKLISKEGQQTIAAFQGQEWQSAVYPNAK